MASSLVGAVFTATWSSGGRLLFIRVAEAYKPEVESIPSHVKLESIWQQRFQVLFALAMKAAGA